MDKEVIMLSMYDNDDNAEDEVVTHTVMLNVMRMLIMMLMNQDNVLTLLCLDYYVMKIMMVVVNMMMIMLTIKFLSIFL